MICLDHDNLFVRADTASKNYGAVYILPEGCNFYDGFENCKLWQNFTKIDGFLMYVQANY